MTWLRRLTAWWKRKRMPFLKRWPADRTPGTPRFAPQRVERLGDKEAETDERIAVFEWQVRELALRREKERELERYRRERRT